MTVNDDNKLVLQVENLSKSYDYNKAVEGISLNMKKSDLLILLGPNGSGKTTILKCIMNLIQSYSGNIVMDDTPSYLPEKKKLYFSYRTDKLLDISRSLKFGLNVKKCVSMLKEFDIPLNQKISNLSQNEISLVYFSLVISQVSSIYIFDEPTWGLDPLSREKVIKYIIDLSTESNTILIAIHEPYLIDKFSGKILVIDEGKIVYQKNERVSGDNQSFEDLFKKIFNGEMK